MTHVPEAEKWGKAYKEQYGELPSGGAVLGRVGAMLTINALREAGPDLTTESFLDALESLKFSDKVTGVETEMSETNHRAGSGIILSQVQDGIWRPVAEME